MLGSLDILVGWIRAWDVLGLDEFEKLPTRLEKGGDKEGGEVEEKDEDEEGVMVRLFCDF